MNWLRRLFRPACRHEFHYSDLKLTGIPKPPDPRRGCPKAELDRWGDEVVCGRHPWHAERVSWTCRKCGKEFRAHCGLYVLHHGTPIKD